MCARHTQTYPKESSPDGPKTVPHQPLTTLPSFPIFPSPQKVTPRKRAGYGVLSWRKAANSSSSSTKGARLHIQSSDFFNLYRYLPFVIAARLRPEKLIKVILQSWQRAPVNQPMAEVLRLPRARFRRWTSRIKRMLLGTESISRLWTWRPLIERFADNPTSDCPVLLCSLITHEWTQLIPHDSCESYDGRSTSSSSRCSLSLKHCNSWIRHP